ncbi:hypothetical protein XENOCAPTIV_008415 [Xenoophorus captivus]|uniref:Uncharacterized protein n=1 Tax=Xenoophorus captivus TaxID=1517983 RepID=A0ABV0RGL1_9TELE
MAASVQDFQRSESERLSEVKGHLEIALLEKHFLREYTDTHFMASLLFLSLLTVTLMRAIVGCVTCRLTAPGASFSFSAVSLENSPYSTWGLFFKCPVKFLVLKHSDVRPPPGIFLLHVTGRKLYIILTESVKVAHGRHVCLGFALAHLRSVKERGKRITVHTGPLEAAKYKVQVIGFFGRQQKTAYITGNRSEHH